MLGGVTVNFVLAFIIYIGMAFAYGDIYVANEDIKEGLLIENPLMNKIGFQTGDKIVSIDGDKIIKYDNEINMKLIMGKQVQIERNGASRTIQMPVDFVSQLSKSEKVPLVGMRVPFAISTIPAESANKSFKAKDVMVSLNGQPAKYYDQVKAILESNKGKTLSAIVLRDNKEVPLQAIVNNEGKLGVQLGLLGLESLEQLGYYKISKKEFGFFESIPVGIEKGKNQLAGYGKQLQMIFNPSTGAYKEVGGFKAIFDIFPETWNWEAFWGRTALLSIMLGVMNLLPIPALDGGHVIFLLYEMITRKKPSDKFLENAQMVGFVLLISLLLFANGNDIYKAILGK
jgi:regulator of sigma E protease